jgi:hypothetical protein
MNRQGLIIGVAVVGAVLVGIALYILLGGEPGDTVAPIRSPDAVEARDIIADIQRRTETQAPARPAPAPAAVTPAAGQGEAGPAAGGAATAAPAPAAPPANELDTAFERAQAFRAEGEMADAQLLYFFAARAGHARAAFELGSMNDPLHHAPETSLLPEPNAFQAYRWYNAARQAGMAEAATRLDALRNWATAAAAKGDAEAERLLLQWE